MSAGVYKIWCEQGATFNLFFTWKSTSGTPIDLSGMTARMQVRKTKSDPDLIASFTTANGRITLGGVAGTVTVIMSAADTAVLTPGVYAYDLEIVNGPEVTRVIEGSFTVDGEVTK